MPPKKTRHLCQYLFFSFLEKLLVEAGKRMVGLTQGDDAQVFDINVPILRINLIVRTSIIQPGVQVNSISIVKALFDRDMILLALLTSVGIDLC